MFFLFVILFYYASGFFSGEELSKCSQQHILLDEKLKDSQTRFVQQQIKIEQIKETEDDVKEGYKSIQSELNETKKKYESMERVIKICNAEKVLNEDFNLLLYYNGKKNIRVHV